MWTVPYISHLKSIASLGLFDIPNSGCDMSKINLLMKDGKFKCFTSVYSVAEVYYKPLT